MLGNHFSDIGCQQNLVHLTQFLNITTFCPAIWIGSRLAKSLQELQSWQHVLRATHQQMKQPRTHKLEAKCALVPEQTLHHDLFFF
jgi:hypothetical protein